MAICIVTGIFPPDIGGPATYVSALTYALSQKGCEVRVVTLGDDSVQYPFWVKKISRTYPLPLRLLIIFLTLFWYGRNCDLWYINGLELPAVLAGKLLRKRMILKVVGDYAWERAMNGGVTSDSIDDFQQKRQVWKVELHKWLRSWYSRQVETVITPSHYLKHLVCGWGVLEERVKVVYNAIKDPEEPPGAASEERRRRGLAEEACFLVTVGRLVSWKGVDRLIHVLALLDKSVNLLIIGEGPEKNILTNLAEKLNVADRIEFLGKIDRTQVLSYLRAADVFLLNTAYEGFSHVLLEAMMVGIPVITTPVCGNPELVKHRQNGLLVQQDDEEDLITSITEVLDDQALRADLVEGGKATVKLYSWTRMLQETMELLVHSC